MREYTKEQLNFSCSDNLVETQKMFAIAASRVLDELLIPAEGEDDVTETDIELR